MNICVNCEVELRPVKNGVPFESMADFGPYEIRNGDVWGCPSCGARIGIGFADRVLTSHFEPGYNKVRQGLVDSGETIVRHWQNLQQKERAALEVP